MPDLLKLVGAVDLGRFEQVHIQAGDRRQVNDGSPAHTLPHAHQDIGKPPPVPVGQERYVAVGQSGFHQQCIDHTGCWRKDLQDHTADNDPAQEMRKVKHGLGYLFQPRRPHLVQQDGQDDRRRESDDQIHQVQKKRVPQCNSEVPHGEGGLEIFQPDKRASGHALEDAVLLKRDDDADHGLVTKQQVPDKRDCQHGIKPPVACQFRNPFIFPSLHFHLPIFPLVWYNYGQISHVFWDYDSDFPGILPCDVCQILCDSGNIMRFWHILRFPHDTFIPPKEVHHQWICRNSLPISVIVQ